MVAFSNVKGEVGVVDLSNPTQLETPMNTVKLDKGFVTCFYWDTEERLYIGDQKGNVSVLNLGNFMGRNILNITLRSILILDSPVVQITGHQKLILVSTYAKCVLCNTEMDEYKQVRLYP